MERTLSLFDCHGQLLFQDFNAGVVGKLEVVDTCHDTGQVVIRHIRGLTRLAHHSKHGCQATETWQVCQYVVKGENIENQAWRILPPIGNLGLPVVNWRKPRRSEGVISLIACRRFLTLRLSMVKPWSALIESIRAGSR